MGMQTRLAQTDGINNNGLCTEHSRNLDKKSIHCFSQRAEQDSSRLFNEDGTTKL